MHDLGAGQQHNSHKIPPPRTTTHARQNAAANEANAAENAKQNAKDASTQAGAEHDKAMARMDDAAKDLNQLLAAPDNGIPDSVFTKAKCVAVVPSMIKGGFIFGAEHGRGVRLLPPADMAAGARLPSSS